jgi:hypothetical protein
MARPHNRALTHTARACVHVRRAAGCSPSYQCHFDAMYGYTAGGQSYVSNVNDAAISSHLISSHRTASHLISSHRVASHRIASHLIASYLLSSPLPADDDAALLYSALLGARAPRARDRVPHPGPHILWTPLVLFPLPSHPTPSSPPPTPGTHPDPLTLWTPSPSSLFPLLTPHAYVYAWRVTAGSCGQLQPVPHLLAV